MTEVPAAAKYDIFFLYNGSPAPAMLEMISCAKKRGLKPALIMVDRGEKLQIADSALLNYDVFTFDVRYKKVGIKRLFLVPILLGKINRLVSRELKARGVVVTTTLDMLLITRLMTLFRGYDIRYLVRDLHSLQLAAGILPRLVRHIERILLRNVQKVLVTSPKFASEYYDHIYSGEILVLENVPQKAVWTEFQRRPRSDGVFVIGFVGILRYKESLFTLIETVERMHREGRRIKVVFAGGSLASDLTAIQAKISIPELFEFSGPYEYSKDIKRLYQDLDLIYAVYDENNLNCQIAMPNKFYESIISRIPLLVAANTFVGEQTAKYGIGAVVSLSEADNLYNLLQSAAEPDSWYMMASDRLQEISPTEIFDRYEQALAKSVL